MADTKNDDNAPSQPMTPPPITPSTTLTTTTTSSVPATQSTTTTTTSVPTMVGLPPGITLNLSAPALPCDHTMFTNEIVMLKAQVLSLQNAHREELDRKENAHKEKVRALEEKIAAKIKSLTKEMREEREQRKIDRATDREEVANLRETVNGMARAMERQKDEALQKRYKLLCGTLCSTYMREAVEYVFPQEPKLYKQVATMELLEKRVADSADRTARERLDKFKATFWNDNFVAVMKEIRKRRNPIAHPVAEIDGDDPPGVDRMKKIIELAFPKKRGILDDACKMVDMLGDLRRLSLKGYLFDD